MNIREEAKEVLGVDIEESVGKNLGTSIVSGKSNDKTVYGFAFTSFRLGFDPTEYLTQRYDSDTAGEIMEDIRDSMDCEEELQRNILYIACVWADQARLVAEGKRPEFAEKVHKVVDALAKVAVKHWTLEPIFDQSSVQGVSQRSVSRVLDLLVKKGVLDLRKQGGMINGEKRSNTYAITNTRDFTPEEIQQKFEALNLLSNKAGEQVEEFLASEPAKILAAELADTDDPYAPGGVMDW